MQHVCVREINSLQPCVRFALGENARKTLGILWEPGFIHAVRCQGIWIQAFYIFCSVLSMEVNVPAWHLANMCCSYIGVGT